MSAFISDNVSGIHPKILDAISKANFGSELPYGFDQWSMQMNSDFSDLFETPVLVIPCTSGTAANCLALSLMVEPINSICVHESSHIFLDESTAPELFTGGARLSPLGGADSKIDLASLQQAMGTIGAMHSAQPGALSLTQSTETGSVYSIDELTQLTKTAKDKGLRTHMDGARFANAVAALDCSPAELTWKAGIDALSFGATKNGAMAAEAVILFKPNLFKSAPYRQKRSGQLLSKQRFLAAQLLAYLKDDLWLVNARTANQKTRNLATGLTNIDGVILPEQITTNMMFVKFTDAQVQRLQKHDLAGYVYANGSMRLCCSWASEESDIAKFIDCVSSAT
jgi:threonine aldolase